MASSTSTAFDGVIDGSLFAFDSTTGQIIPQTERVREAIETALIDAFGTNLRVDAESPAGRLVEMWTMMVTRFCAVTALYANQLNPRYATGQMLDAIGSLFSTKRNARTPTIIKCAFSGTANTVIPQGSRISDNNGHVFTTDMRLILVEGSAVGSATCATPGPITVANGTVTQMLDTVSGWSSVENTATLSVGEEFESDFSFRSRVINARWTGTAFIEDIIAELNRVNGMKSAFVYENNYGTTMWIDSSMALVNQQPQEGKYVKMEPHSILVLTYGSYVPMDVARAIYATKSAGCAMTSLGAPYQGEAKGTPVTVDLTDQSSGQVYAITYNEPIIRPFKVRVLVYKGAYVGTDSELIGAVKSAVSAWAKGEYPYVDGIQMGQDISTFEIGAAISDAIPSIKIRSVYLREQLSLGVWDDEHTHLNVFLYEMASLVESETTVEIVQ